jgi:hypothetical protein
MMEFKKTSREIIIGVTIALISAVLIAKGGSIFGGSSTPDDKTIKKECIKTLHLYCDGLNNDNFEAYTYFSEHVDRFITMKNTTPEDINTYIHGLFKKQYTNYKARIDDHTFQIIAKADNYYEATVIMYGDYYFIPKQEYTKNIRAKTELRFDKNFRIKYFRQVVEK